jgi:hypothetical protein
MEFQYFYWTRGVQRRMYLGCEIKGERKYAGTQVDIDVHGGLVGGRGQR